MARHRLVIISKNTLDASPVEVELAGMDYGIRSLVCRDAEETIRAVKGSDLIIDVGVPLPGAVIQKIDRARGIVSLGHAYDQIDCEAATRKGIMVVNTPGFCTEEVSNHTVMLLLACARQLVRLDRLVRARRWQDGALAELPPIPPIEGQVLGLVGFGVIGRAVARKARALSLSVIVHDPYLPPWIAQEYRVELVADLEKLAARSDFVSLHVPLNDRTREMVGKSFLQTMKPTAFLINTGRGQTLDEAALATALKEGWIAGAGLDVFHQEPLPVDSPLLDLDNVILTPHTAGLSEQVLGRGFQILGQEAARILKGAWPMSLVNPEVRYRLDPRLPAGDA